LADLADSGISQGHSYGSFDLSQDIRQVPKALSVELCQALITQFMKDRRVEADPQSDYSTRRFLYLSDKPEWMSLMDQVQSIADQLVANYFAHFACEDSTGPTDWFDDGFVLAHYRPGDTCVLHDDGQNPEPPHNGFRMATLLFYLNDVNEGGETVFPRQNLAVSPELGKAILFPATYAYPHRVVSPTNDRYVLQTWIIDPGMVVNRRESWDDTACDTNS